MQIRKSRGWSSCNSQRICLRSIKNTNNGELWMTRLRRSYLQFKIRQLKTKRRASQEAVSDGHEITK